MSVRAGRVGGIGDEESDGMGTKLAWQGALVTALVVCAVPMIGLLASPQDGVSSDHPSVEGPAAPPTVQPRYTVAIESIDAYGSSTGTGRVVIHFDGPVPDDPVTYVTEVEHPDAPGLAYTIQDPDGLEVCSHTHRFPGDRGTVDLLIPEDWLAATITDLREYPVPVEAHDNPAKVVQCDPHEGYLQIGIWGPSSDDPDDVEVSVSADRTEVVVDLQP